MKKYIFSIICISSVAQGMEVAKTREPREWDAQAYAQGNQIQEIAAMKLLQESSIKFVNKKVLDVGCGTGNISAKIAEDAQKVHGIDASHNMIEYAQKNFSHVPNVTFKQSFAEEFTSDELYDAAVSIFCLHWIQDKQQVMEKINHVLPMNGDFFGTHQSTTDPEPPHLAVFRELIPTLATKFSFLKEMNLTNKAIDFYVTPDEEFKDQLLQSGFEIVSYEQKSVDLTLEKEDIEAALRPIIMSRPFLKEVPSDEKELFFSCFMKKFVKRLTYTEDGKYFMPALVCSKVFHARKIAEIQ